jgi:UDP-N-acetylmuramoylalanine--D-glutamate ligase
MLTIPATRGTTVAVMGLGLSGLATCRALLASGASVWAWDDAEARRQQAAASGASLVDLARCDWGRVDRLILSPGIPLDHPAPHPVAASARAAGVPIEGDVELLAISQTERTIVGITGTNGKSTTSALAAELLRGGGRGVQLGGNIGVPVLELWPEPAADLFVLELSSYQLELTRSLACRVAVLLNLSPDHLDRHGGLAGYAAAKRRIFLNQADGDVAIVGIDDPNGRAVHKELQATARRVIPISVQGPCPGGIFCEHGILVDALGGLPRVVTDLGPIESLRGTHNAQNAAAAYAVARVLGVSPEDAAIGLRRFRGLAHRQEPLLTVDGVRFVNDSKATNPDSAARALQSFGEVFWIAGGRPKPGGLEAVLPHLSRVRCAYLIGEAAAGFARELQGRIPIRPCDDLETATRVAFEDARGAAADRPVVLLSPACASFDQFTSFEARGDAFKSLVAELARSRARQGATVP